LFGNTTRIHMLHLKSTSAYAIKTDALLFTFAIFMLCLLLPFSDAHCEECGDCHLDRLHKRTGVIGQMKGGSHHVQGVEVTGQHCYACHWEATPEGRINERYHSGSKTKDAPVDLVVWGAGNRPTIFIPFSTAASFRVSSIGTSNEREQVASISNHCLSCHNDRNNDTTPFVGDSHTPRQYAWDGQSIAARYSQTGSASWSRYSTANVNGKWQITKAFSAHGNSAASLGGWSTVSGYDKDITTTRGGSKSRNVECFDCHNSHGSGTTGITSSYLTFGSDYNGGILKETMAGLGGYQYSYTPSSNLDKHEANPYNPGAGLCFDCHETAKPGSTPWGYKTTFGAEQAIMGYKDTSRFNSGIKGSTSRFTGRHTRTAVASSHLKSGRFLSYSTHDKINGLCTPCHDPHGISPTLGTSMQYALPLLKGTWLTSPYREDSPPARMPTKGSFTGNANNMAVSWEKGELKKNPAESQAAMSYNTDRNTFGNGRLIIEKDDQFAGLCLKCHKKSNFTANKNDVIHRAVKGWGSNREHSFPCSKCHQAHNSGLPRLMQTNCLESGPSGLRDSSAAPWMSSKSYQQIAAINKPAKEAVVGCHVRRAARNSGPPALPSEQQQWKSVNPW